MCTIIRVKRKITDDPADCLIIECKRNKLINGSLSTQEELSNNIIQEQKDSEYDLQPKKIKNSTQNGQSVNESIKEVLKYAGSAQTEV